MKANIDTRKFLKESGLVYEMGLGGASGTVEDFFDFLAKNPKAGSIAHTYYCAPVSINKNLEGRGSNAVKNPMFSENFGHAIIFKCNWYMFNFGELYSKAMTKIDPNWQPDPTRQTSLVKHPDMKYVESGPNGDYFNILPKQTSKSVYAIYDESAGVEGLKDKNNYKIVDYTQIQQFFPVRKPYEGPVDYRKFFVSRTYQIAAGTYLFKNSQFIYAYFGDEPNR